MLPMICFSDKTSNMEGKVVPRAVSLLKTGAVI